MSMGPTPDLQRIIDAISRANPLQRKRIAGLISGQDARYWEFGAWIGHALKHLLLDDSAVERVAGSYDWLCREILREQIRFRKTGTYDLDDASVAEKAIYADPVGMRTYVTGLLLTYLFWPNHYAIFRFFQDRVDLARTDHALEVGAGHGLFTADLLRRSPGVSVTIVDISEASIQLAREVIQSFEVSTANVHFVQADFLRDGDEGAQHDLVILGEVIEHVNDAPLMLRRAASRLRADGKAFITTCANCPAPDHIYHFRNIREIRGALSDAGFDILDELVLAAEDVEPGRWESEMVTINYAAVCGVHD